MGARTKMKLSNNKYSDIMSEYCDSATPPEEVLRGAQLWLAASVPAANNLNVWDAPDAVLLAEAINLAAKIIDDSFYDIKPEVFAAASQIPGVESGWSCDGTFCLHVPGGGSVHSHDPYGELAELVDNATIDHEWSGLKRQNYAHFALESPAARRLLIVAEEHRWTDAQLRRAMVKLSRRRQRPSAE